LLDHNEEVKCPGHWQLKVRLRNIRENVRLVQKIESILKGVQGKFFTNQRQKWVLCVAHSSPIWLITGIRDIMDLG